METKTYGRFDSTGVVINYERNISNDILNPAATITTTGAGTVDTLPMINDGSNAFEYEVVRQSFEKLDFSAAFNGNKGGIICNRLNNDTEIFTRTTVVNKGGTAGGVILQVFLVFDKTIPGTGVSIVDSETTIGPGDEAAFLTKFFANGIEAIYPRIETATSRAILTRGFDVTASENQ